MKTICLLFMFLLFCADGKAQTDSIPVYLIKADTSVENLPNEYWQMLADTSGELTLSKVSSPAYFHQFHENVADSTGFGYSNLRHYWQRARLKNVIGKPLKIIFTNNPEVYQYDLYVIRQTGTQHFTNGWGVPYSKRDSFKLRYAVPVQVLPDEVITIYKKMYLVYEQTNELSFGFKSYEDFMNTAYVDEPRYNGDVRNGLIAGILIFGFFINIFFYRIAKEKVYLWYALLLLFEGLWYLVVRTDLFFRENPMAGFYFDFIVTYSAFFFCVTQFVRYFLKTYKYYPRWDKLLVTLILVTIASQFIKIYTEQHAPFEWRGIPTLIQDLLFTCTMTALLISFFFPKHEQDKFTNLSVAAALPALFLWSILYGVTSIYDFVEVRYGTERPAFVAWLNDHNSIIEMFCVAWFAIVFSWILLQRYAMLRKEYTQQALERERERSELMNRQKEELERQVEERTKELKQSIAELKTTQSQLIQAEKMASLGELTAGIAHEIQNPLNFVNNFSEVSVELVEELEDAIQKNDEEEVSALATDIKDNLTKIAHHGKRADSIVKGMLQHSRTSTGKKEPTDINALADEFLRLSYHGLRAKDKSFNATMKTNYDPNLGKIDVAPQEIGRVLLNMFTNAFHSIDDKKKLNIDGYEPILEVSTTRQNNNVVIRVKDNGMGIPAKVLDKIYQPFFTTKPTGKGTGLGLSMSYDIIKSHGGEIKVESKEGEGAEFIISLPA
jgi:two-component system, NtrC family, sensor kinase